MIDHVGIYGSRMAEGLSAFNVGLVVSVIDDITFQNYSMSLINPKGGPEICMFNIISATMGLLPDT